MKKLALLFTFIIALSAHAENSRRPAVLDGTCNIDVATTETITVNGKEVVSDRAVADILKDQCNAVKKCMYSANEEDMDELKSLEAVACNNNLNAVTTKTPGAIIDKNYDGKRKAKFEPRDQPATQTTTVTPTNTTK